VLVAADDGITPSAAAERGRVEVVDEDRVVARTAEDTEVIGADDDDGSSRGGIEWAPVRVDDDAVVAVAAVDRGEVETLELDRVVAVAAPEPRELIGTDDQAIVAIAAIDRGGEGPRLHDGVVA